MEKVDRPIYFCIDEKDKRKVKTKEVTNEQKFRFGGGKVIVAIQEVSVSGFGDYKLRILRNISLAKDKVYEEFQDSCSRRRGRW